LDSRSLFARFYGETSSSLPPVVSDDAALESEASESPTYFTIFRRKTSTVVTAFVASIPKLQ
jgi:hypothetical protein